jgi:hypothetical protein
MKETLSLPKLAEWPRPHSAADGPLARFQSHLSREFGNVIGQMNNQASLIADECHKELIQKMAEYREKEGDIISRRKEIIHSISTTHETNIRGSETFDLSRVDRTLIKVSEMGNFIDTV